MIADLGSRSGPYQLLGPWEWKLVLRTQLSALIKLDRRGEARAVDHELRRVFRDDAEAAREQTSWLHPRKRRGS